MIWIIIVSILFGVAPLLLHALTLGLNKRKLHQYALLPPMHSQSESENGGEKKDFMENFNFEKMIRKMIEKFKQISREAIYGPISYDPDLKESLDEYVQRTKLNATQEEQLKEKKWKTKLEEQQKYPWLKKK